MTDLYVSVAILVVYILGCCLVWRQQIRRAHRRAVRCQMRLVRRYTATVPPPYDRANVVELRSYSVRVPEKRAS